MSGTEQRSSKQARSSSSKWSIMRAEKWRLEDFKWKEIASVRGQKAEVTTTTTTSAPLTSVTTTPAAGAHDPEDATETRIAAEEGSPFHGTLSKSSSRTSSRISELYLAFLESSWIAHLQHSPGPFEATTEAKLANLLSTVLASSFCKQADFDDEEEEIEQCRSSDTSGVRLLSSSEYSSTSTDSDTLREENTAVVPPPPPQQPSGLVVQGLDIGGLQDLLLPGKRNPLDHLKVFFQLHFAPRIAGARWEELWKCFLAEHDPYNAKRELHYSLKLSVDLSEAIAAKRLSPVLQGTMFFTKSVIEAIGGPLPDCGSQKAGTSSSISGTTTVMDEQKIVKDYLKNCTKSDLYSEVWEYLCRGQIKMEKQQYEKAVEFFQKAFKIATLLNSRLKPSDHVKMDEMVFPPLFVAYQALAVQTGSVKPLENAMYYLNKLMSSPEKVVSNRLYRFILWKSLQDNENALIDALAYFSMETHTDCNDLDLERVHRSLTNIFEDLVDEECKQVNGYADSVRPFLSQDFINLWMACDCDDPLVEDIWNVREEDESTPRAGVAPIKESQYKDALRSISDGELSTVVEALERALKEGKKYRCEAALLLALAHTRLDGSIVDEYLDQFLSIWDQTLHSYTVHRRKQLIVRYGSISRAIRSDPFGGQRLPNTTKEMEANMYLQEALVIFWMRDNPDIGLTFWKETFRDTNERRMRNIQLLCSLALNAKRDCTHAKILQLRMNLELQMAMRCSTLEETDLKPLEKLVKKLNRTQKYSAFADLCLYSVYIANAMVEKAKPCCHHMIKALFYRGQPLAFSIRNDWRAGDKQTATRLDKLIRSEPENYLAHILIYFYERERANLRRALWHIERAIKYWPYHVSMDNLLPHIREFVRCRILYAVQEQIDEMADILSYSAGTEPPPSPKDLKQRAERTRYGREQYEYYRIRCIATEQKFNPKQGLKGDPQSQDPRTTCPVIPGLSGIPNSSTQSDDPSVQVKPENSESPSTSEDVAVEETRKMIGAAIEHAEQMHQQIVKRQEATANGFRETNGKVVETESEHLMEQLQDKDTLQQEGSRKEGGGNPELCGDPTEKEANTSQKPKARRSQKKES